MYYFQFNSLKNKKSLFYCSSYSTRFIYYSYRFSDLFLEANLVRDMQSELDDIIEQGVVQITRLLKNSESSSPSSDSIEEDFNVARHKHNYLRGISNIIP